MLEARDIVKELGHGRPQGARAEGRDLALNAGELTLADGPVGQRQDHAAVDPRLHPDADRGHARSRRRIPRRGSRRRGWRELRRRHIGFIFQSYNLFPTLTAEENVRSRSTCAASAARTRRARAAALQQVGLRHRLKSYPANLSGGEQQRVAVARALGGAPSVMLADEPTAALDSENGGAVMALLAEIAKDTSRAVLAVTHDPRPCHMPTASCASRTA